MAGKKSPFSNVMAAATDEQIETLVGFGMARTRASSMSKIAADSAIKKFSQEAGATAPLDPTPPLDPVQVDEPTLAQSGIQLLDALVDDLINDSVSERNGEQDRNSYRLSKGGKLIKIEEAAKQLVKDGTFDKATSVMDYTRNRFISILHDKGVTNPAKQLHPSEMSIVRKAFRVWIGDQKNKARTFELVDEVNPNTNNPLVSDSGQPIQQRVSSIATNNLYYLADYVDENNFDRLASIAWRYSEDACQYIGKVLKNNESKANAIIKEIATKRVVQKNANKEIIVVNDEPLRLNLNEVELRQYLRKYLPDLGENDIASIKVDRAFYEGGFATVLERATAVYQQNGLPLDQKGQVPRTVLLERLLQPYIDDPSLIDSVLTQSDGDSEDEEGFGN